MFHVSRFTFAKNGKRNALLVLVEGRTFVFFFKSTVSPIFLHKLYFLQLSKNQRDGNLALKPEISLRLVLIKVVNS